MKALHQMVNFQIQVILFKIALIKINNGKNLIIYLLDSKKFNLNI